MGDYSLSMKMSSVLYIGVRDRQFSDTYLIQPKENKRDEMKNAIEKFIFQRVIESIHNCWKKKTAERKWQILCRKRGQNT